MNPDRTEAAVSARSARSGGTSLSGGHVVAVAADLPEVSAVVCQVPFNGFPRRVEGRSAAVTLRLLLAMVSDRVRGALGRLPRYIQCNT
jgi:hypothetical protein